MEISITPAKSHSISDTLFDLKSTFEKFHLFSREESHQIDIDEDCFENGLQIAAITALVESFKADGYLLDVTGSQTPYFVKIPKEDNVAAQQAVLAYLNTFADFERKGIKNAVYYITAELIDNIRDHSRSPFGILSVRTSPPHLTITIADVGISIPNAYRSAGIVIRDDCDALKKAQSGLSSKTVEERGTGLPSIARLATEAFQGSFNLISASSVLIQTPQKLLCKAAPFFWQGTIVSITGKLPKELDLHHYVA